MKIIPALLLLTLTGCANGVIKSEHSPAQYWRPAQQDKPVKISGALSLVRQDLNSGLALFVDFDGERALTGALNRDASGEVCGGSWQGRPVSASCSSQRKTRDWVDVRCLVFVDNERTVTLTF